MNKEKEYLRRNLLHAKAAGVYFGIKAVVDRVETMRRKPLWMLEMLNRELVKANVVQKEMAAHCEEMKEGRAAKSSGAQPPQADNNAMPFVPQCKRCSLYGDCTSIQSVLRCRGFRSAAQILEAKTLA